MSFRKSLVLASSLALLLAVGGQSDQTMADNLRAAQVGGNPSAPTADETTRAVFSHFARSLAAALTDQGVRQVVHDQVGKKFDGDYNALYRDLANQRLPNGSTLRSRLARTQVPSLLGTNMTDPASRLEFLDAYTSALPRLQVAVPVHFDEWDPETTVPLVAFLPPDVDDEELIEIEAYDAQGQTYLLDTRVAPTEPVIVVSLNERTDEHGFLRALGDSSLNGGISYQLAEPCAPETAIDTCDGGGGGGGGGTTTSVCTARTHAFGDKEILYQIKINNDHEPWTRGAPEIYASYSFADSTNVKGKYYMGGVDDEGRWYTVNGHLFYWQSYYGNVFVNSIWEEDGGSSATAKFNFFGIDFTVNIMDSDDGLGAAPVSFHDPICGYYSTGDAEFKMRYE